MLTLLGLTHTGSFNDHIPISYNIHSNSVIRNRPLVLVLLRGSAFDHNFIPHSREHFHEGINSHAVSGQAVADCGLCFIPRSFCELSLVPAKCFHGFFYNVFLVHESTSLYFDNAISCFGVIVKLLFVFYSFFSVTGCSVTGVSSPLAFTNVGATHFSTSFLAAGLFFAPIQELCQ